MAYKQKGIEFGNGDPVDKNWTGEEESGSKAELNAFKKDRKDALKKLKFKQALKIQKDIKSNKKARKNKNK